MLGHSAAPNAAPPSRPVDRASDKAFPHVDFDAFSADVDALHAELKADLGAADLVHLRTMERWGRTCSGLGYAFAWMIPNPVAPILIGLGNVARWASVTHPVLHRGYDAVPDVPERYRSRTFARGWRRFIDWPDWLYPEAWCHEHNQLHHYHTGQLDDPDLVERNARLMRASRAPRWLKGLVLVAVMVSWKLTYYAPNTFFALKQHRRIRAQSREPSRHAPLPTMGQVARFVFPGERLLLPFTRSGAEFYLRCVLPYAALRFGVIPALFLPLGTGAWFAVLVNSILAEIVANVVSFVIIAPNHSGDDLYRFEGRCTSKAEFHVQQVAGSVNYPGGTDLADFLQGYLNYQIEHHVWPDLPLLKYRQAAPRLKAICAKHGVPYIEESVFRRFARLWSIMMGDSSMRRIDTRRPHLAAGATQAS